MKIKTRKIDKKFFTSGQKEKKVRNVNLLVVKTNLEKYSATSCSCTFSGRFPTQTCLDSRGII